MCIGRIDLYHCGCYSGPKTFRCETAQKNEKCDGIGPLITANILSFCDVCAEHRKTKKAELDLIVAESRNSATVKAANSKAATVEDETDEDDTFAAPGPLATIDASGHAVIELAQPANPPTDEEKDRTLSIPGSQDEVVEKGGAEHSVLEVDEATQPAASSTSKFAKFFYGCFKGGA